jgi:arsenite-transporting ATPase
MASDLPHLDAPTYKWIFVGGKGGVGKTTTACSIAVSLTRTRNRVLLVSTDPASNIGDVFQQHFGSEALPVESVPHLWAMEFSSVSGTSDEGLKPVMNLPGMDELNALSSLFDSIERDEFDVVVFDTAPTGHTMRFLQIPKSCQQVLGGMGMFGGAAMTALAPLVGGDDLGRKMERFQARLSNTARQLTNSMECTFVCVLIPEFSPFYETERLVEFLDDNEIECHVLVVNQIMGEATPDLCNDCRKRCEIQQKYLGEIRDTYPEFRIVEVPVQEDEIKGIESVKKFARAISGLFSDRGE